MEIIQYFVPAPFWICASPVALIHDNQVKEISRILAIQSWSPFTVINRLVNRKEHVMACINHTLDFMPRLTEDSKVFAVRVINQEITVSQEQNLRPASTNPFTGPTHVPEFESNLRCYDGFPCASCQRQEESFVPL